jgi:quercetin dioxygenase-like cupin family protein
VKARYDNHIDKVKPVEMRPGIHRKTLVYDEDLMLCHFHLEKGAVLELHSHEAAQMGYVISGKVEFFKEDESTLTVTSGSGYYFPSQEKHGSRVLEDTFFIECFAPGRPEYVDSE